MVMLYLLGVCGFILAFYLYFTWNNNYWVNRGVLHDKPVFFLGNYKDALCSSKHFGVMFADLYSKYTNAAYIGYFKLRTPSILVRDPELIRNVLVKDFDCFANNDFKVDKEVDPMLCENVFVQTGEEWKRNRTQWTAGLTTSKLKAMYDTICDKCENMVRYIKTQNENTDHAPMEPQQLSSMLFTDIIVNSIFGLKLDNFTTKNAFKIVVDSFFSPNFFEGMKLLMFTLAPDLARVLKIRFVSKRILNELSKIAKDIMDDRQSHEMHKNNPLDSIIYNDFKGNIDITNNRVSGIVFNFLIDGTETSSGVAGFMLHALAANPLIQAKLRSELEKSEKDENGKIPYEEIHRLPYLEMIYQETIRMYPPALVLHRESTKPYTFPPAFPGAKSLNVEVGTPVTVSIYGLHMDPQYFPNPEKFDPERFNEENKTKIKKYSYLPFGEGPRICLGFRLAANQIKPEIAAIVRNFKLRLAQKMIDKTITVDQNIMIFRNTGGLWVTFHELKK